MDDVTTENRGGVGLEMTPAHFPGRAPIDTYGGGGFRFAEMSHKGSILCLPSGIYGWTVETPDAFNPAVFSRLKHETDLEVLLVGTGTQLLPLPESVQSFLSAIGIRSDSMSTGAAARTYNVLLSEGRAAGAALLAVE